MREMQTRRTKRDHHHQDRFAKTDLARSSPDGELVAIARSKGQVLTESTLRLIRETLELRGVSLAEFVVAARPHFRNNILNPSGFLINLARNFHQLSRPARLSAAHGSIPATGEVCGGCKGEKYVMVGHKIEPCQECSTPEFRLEWEVKEAERAQKTCSGPRDDGGFRIVKADDGLKQMMYKAFHSD